MKVDIKKATSKPRWIRKRKSIIIGFLMSEVSPITKSSDLSNSTKEIMVVRSPVTKIFHRRSIKFPLCSVGIL